jgi:hypothetical protein
MVAGNIYRRLRRPKTYIIFKKKLNHRTRISKAVFAKPVFTNPELNSKTVHGLLDLLPNLQNQYMVL